MKTIFTAAERAMMNTGRTMAESKAALGGAWTVGNIPFPQAISAEHAIKLYSTTFAYRGEQVFLAE